MRLSILAVGVGYFTLSVAVAVLYALGTEVTGDAPAGLSTEFFAIAAVVSLGFATLSGYLTALIARRSPIVHTAVLAGLLFLVWCGYRLLGHAAEPAAISLVNLAVGGGGVLAGGWLRRRQQLRQEGTQPPSAQRHSPEKHSS